jgi:hypothetical protein
MRPRLPDVIALAWLFVFGLSFCAPVLAGRVPVATDTFGLWAPWSQLPHAPAHNLALTDSAYQALPWAVFARDALADGEWPFWDPYTFAGYSFAANAQSQQYYPLTWALWLLPISGAFQVRALFNLALAGWGMYAFCRVLGTGRTGATIAGMAFLGSGMSQAAIDAPFISSVYGWLPLALAACDRALRERGLRWTALAALALGMLSVAGNPQWVVYAYLVVGCWIAWRGVQLWLAAPSARRERLRSLGILTSKGTLALMGGLGLASVHFVPFLEMARLSNRVGVRISSNSDPPLYLLRLLMPGFFGNPVDIKGYPMGASDLWYVGVVTLVLGLLAARWWASDVLNRKWRGQYFALAPESSTPFWVALAGLSVLVAYGVGPFLYARWLPGLSASPPVRIGYIFIAACCVLAALGWDRLWRASGEVAASRLRGFAPAALPMAPVAVALLVAASFWVNGAAWNSQQAPVLSRRLQADQLVRAGAIMLACVLVVAARVYIDRRAPSGGTQEEHAATGRLKQGLALLALGVLGVDLLSAMPGYTTFVPPESMAPSAPSIDWLKAQRGEWRLMGVDNPAPALVPNIHLLFGVASVAGYDSLHPRSYDEFWGLVEPSLRPDRQVGPYSNVFVRPQVYTSTLASLLNSRYIASTGDLAVLPGYAKVYTGEISIYENLNSLARAFLVARSGARTLTPQQTLSRLGSPDFDPRREVLFEIGSGSPAKMVGDEGTAQDGGQPGNVQIVSYKRNSVELDVIAEAPAWLVLADNNYPGWSVSVNGQESRIYTADHILRAVPVGTGRHTVVFRFVPSGFFPAMLLSLGTLAATVVVLVFGRKRARVWGSSVEAGND